MANPTSDFLAWASAAGANVQAQTDYAVDPAVQTGQQAGRVPSPRMNKTWRQSTAMVAMLGLWMANTLQENVLDDGNWSTTLLQQWEAALTTYANAPSPASLVHGGPDTGGVNALSVAASPAIAALRADMLLLVFPDNPSANATAQQPATLTLNNTGTGNLTTNVYRQDGTPIQKGDWAANLPTAFITDGQNWYLYSTPVQPATAYVHQGDDTSTAANAITIAASPALPSPLTENNVLFFTPAFTNTGSVTLNGLPFLRSNGTPLMARDIVAGERIAAVSDGNGNWKHLGFAMGEVQRVILALSIYVDAVNGSDTSGDGTSGKPFQTLNMALGASTIGFAAGTLTIVLVTPGRYIAPPTYPKGTGPIKIVGGVGSAAGNQPGNFTVYGSTGAQAISNFQFGGSYTVQGVTFENDTASLNTLAVSPSTTLLLQNCPFTSNQTNSNFHIFSAGGVIVDNGCSFAGNMGGIAQAQGGGAYVNFNSAATIGIVGNPNYSIAAVVATEQGIIRRLSGQTFNGAATGQTFLSLDQGNVNRGGQGDFPGNQAGTVDKANFAVFL